VRVILLKHACAMIIPMDEYEAASLALGGGGETCANTTTTTPAAPAAGRASPYARWLLHRHVPPVKTEPTVR